MAPRTGRVALVCSLLVAAGCAGSRQPTAAEIRPERVVDHVRVLATDIGPRPADDQAAARAAAYIEGQLGGLVAVERVPVGHVELPAIDVGPFRWRGPGAIDIADQDLLVRFPGQGPALLLMAHYDSVPGSPGAVDNAAAVGVLIELARALAARPPARPVLIAFTAGEERGLVGARALAPFLLENGPPIGLAVSLDLVGAARTAVNGLSGLLGRPWLRWIAARIEDSGADIEVPVPHRMVSRLAPGAERSDHGAFTERGVPAFHLYGRGDRRIYLAYHSRWDTPDRLDPAAIDGAARLTVALARSTAGFPPAGGDPGYWVPGTAIILPGPLVQGIEAALAAVAIFLLFFMWRAGGPRARGRGTGLLAVALLIGLLWLLAYLVLALARGPHPLPWAHIPLAATLLIAGVMAAGAALLWLSPLGRIPLVGRRRFAAAAALPLLFAGAGLLALGAHEIAWLPLAAAVLLCAAALAPGRAAPLLLFGLSLAPLFPALSPSFLREALFNGFYPAVLPLPFFLAIILTPHAIAAVPLLGRALPLRAGLPRWAAAVPAAILVALALAAAIGFHHLPCDAGSFGQLGLACEVAQ